MTTLAILNSTIAALKWAHAHLVAIRARRDRLRSMQCPRCRDLVGVPVSWPDQHCRQCGEALVPFHWPAIDTCPK